MSGLHSVHIHCKMYESCSAAQIVIYCIHQIKMNKVQDRCFQENVYPHAIHLIKVYTKILQTEINMLSYFQLMYMHK